MNKEDLRNKAFEEAEKIYNINQKQIQKKINKKINERKKEQSIFVLLIISILCIIVLEYTKKPVVKNQYLDGADITNLVNKKEEAVVDRVVDGDTIEVIFKTGILVDGNKYKVRLIGVDTPESKARDKSKNTKEGEIAYLYTKEQLEKKEITLEFDVGVVDRYNRLLAYVWKDGKMYNEHLLNIGYAKIMTIQPNVKYIEKFKRAEKNARENNIGFFKEEKKWKEDLK